MRRYGKLTPVRVRGIKRRAKRTKDSVWSFAVREARRYKVSAQAIRNVVIGKSWGHVK